MHASSSGDVEVEEVQRNEFLYINNSPLTQPTDTRPVYFRENQNTIRISPTSISAATFDYIRTPSAPNWMYVVVNDKPLYNPTGSVNFELHASEETELVYRILALAGIAIEKPQLTQVAAGLQGAQIQQEKQ